MRPLLKRRPPMEPLLPSPAGRNAKSSSVAGSPNQRRRQWRHVVLLIRLVLKPVVFAVILFVAVCAADAADDPPGWELVWSDEFNGNTFDASKWEFEVNARGGGN